MPGPGSNPEASRSGSWKFVHRFSGHRDGIWEVTCFRTLIATASADSTVRLWNNTDQHRLKLTSCLYTFTMVFMFCFHSSNISIKIKFNAKLTAALLKFMSMKRA